MAHEGRFETRPVIQMAEHVRVTGREAIPSNDIVNGSATNWTHFDVEEHLKQKMVRELAQKLVDDELVVFYEMTKAAHNFGRTFMMELNVGRPNTDNHMMVEGQQFVVNNEAFSNSELTEAVKRMFPERFI